MPFDLPGGSIGVEVWEEVFEYEGFHTFHVYFDEIRYRQVIFLLVLGEDDIFDFLLWVWVRDTSTIVELSQGFFRGYM